MAKKDASKTPAAKAAPVATKASRTAANSTRRMAKNKKVMQDKEMHPPKVPRGTARAKRRAAAKAGATGGTEFSIVWATFRQRELDAAKA
jgi:hypothetical protein